MFDSSRNVAEQQAAVKPVPQAVHIQLDSQSWDGSQIHLPDL